MKARGVRAGGEKYFSSVKQLCVGQLLLLLDNTIGWPLVQGLRNDDKAVRRISLSCNLSLAPGFSPVGAGDAAPSRFNGFVAAGAENG